MFRRNRHERHAVRRIHARGEHIDACIDVLDVKRKRHAFAAADPIALHRLDAFGPAFEPVDPRQQPIRVIGNLEVPLREVAALDQMSAAPALAVVDLFVGEHGLIVRAPVYRRFALVGQPALEHAQEEPLVPFIVRGIAGRELARPIVARAHQLDLPAHVVDVRARPGVGLDPALDRRVLCGQAECIPAHRVDDVVAAHAHHPRYGVAERVVFRVADVQIARRIRQHLQDVVLRARVGVVGTVDPVRFPAGLPGLFDRTMVVRQRPFFEHFVIVPSPGLGCHQGHGRWSTLVLVRRCALSHSRYLEEKRLVAPDLSRLALGA